VLVANLFFYKTVYTYMHVDRVHEHILPIWTAPILKTEHVHLKISEVTTDASLSMDMSSTTKRVT
jgi:hypothetical protein